MPLYYPERWWVHHGPSLPWNVEEDENWLLIIIDALAKSFSGMCATLRPNCVGFGRLFWFRLIDSRSMKQYRSVAYSISEDAIVGFLHDANKSWCLQCWCYITRWFEVIDDRGMKVSRSYQKIWCIVESSRDLGGQLQMSKIKWRRHLNVLIRSKELEDFKGGV